MFLIIDKDQCSLKYVGSLLVPPQFSLSDLAQNILRFFVNIHADDTYEYNSKDLDELWLVADLSANLVPSQGERENTDFYHSLSYKQS